MSEKHTISAETKPRSHWPISVLSTTASVFNTLLPLFLARILIPDEMGTFKIFFFYLALLPAFSLTNGLISGLAFWSGQSQEKKTEVQLSTFLILAHGLLFTVIALCARSPLESHFGWSPLVATLFAISVLGSVAGSFFEEAAISSGKIWTGAFFYSGFEIIRTAAIVVSVYVWRSAEAVFISHTVMSTLKVLGAVILGYKFELLRFFPAKEDLKKVWAYAAPVSVAAIMAVFVGQPDQLILTNSLVPSDFAIYSIGCLSLGPLAVLEHSITRVLIPQMAGLFSQNKVKEAASVYKHVVEQLSFLFIPAVFGLATFALPIIEILYTKQYSGAAKYLHIYAAMYLFYIFPYDAVARAKGKANWILKTFSIFCIISFAVSFLFIKMWGPFGGLAGILFSGAIIRLYALKYMMKETGWSLVEFLPLRKLLERTIICAALTALSLCVKPLFANSWVWFLVVGPIFAILYFIASILATNIAIWTKKEHSRVLIVTQGLGIGGLERLVLTLCKTLQIRKSNLNVSLFVFDYTDTDPRGTILPEFHKIGVPVEQFKKPEGFSVVVIFRLLRTLINEQVEVVHCQDIGGLMYVAIAKILLLGRIKIIQTQHSFIHLARNPRYKLYEKLFTRFADVITVVSEEIKDTYGTLGYPADKVHLILNGVQFPDGLISADERLELRKELLGELSDAERAQVSKNMTTSWLLCMARLYPGKGQDHTLKMWGEIDPAIRKKITLFIIGP